MRFHKARHFRFAENAVTTRILRRLHVQTTSSSPLRCFAHLGVPIFTAPLACLGWQGSAEDDLLGLGRHDAVSGNVGKVGVIPVESRQFSSGHQLKCIPFVHTTQRGYAGLAKNALASRVGERATPCECDPLSPRRTGQADFPTSGSPENVSPQAYAGSCTAASLHKSTSPNRWICS